SGLVPGDAAGRGDRPERGREGGPRRPSIRCHGPGHAGEGHRLRVTLAPHRRRHERHRRHPRIDRTGARPGAARGVGGSDGGGAPLTGPVLGRPWTFSLTYSSRTCSPTDSWDLSPSTSPPGRSRGAFRTRTRSSSPSPSVSRSFATTGSPTRSPA